MSVVVDLAREGSTAPVRIVMLPPAYAAPEDFVEAGFVSAVRARGLAIDLVFADLQARHVTDDSLTAQVWELITPARAKNTRVWLGGISLGGYGVWEVARRYPKHFAAVVPVCGGIYWPYAPERGWLPPQERAQGERAFSPLPEHPLEPELPEEYARALGKTPVWMFHGADDPVVSPRQSEIMFEAIKEEHGDVRLWEYAGWQHNVWEKAYAEPGLPTWLLAHRLSEVTPVYAEKTLVPVHPVPVRLNPAVYDAYAGDYVSAGVLEVTIFRQGDGLFARNHVGQVSELLPETATTFFYPHGGASRLAFQKTPGGAVKGILFRDDRHEEVWDRRDTPERGR